MNPWKLSPREADTLDAVVEHGCRKAVARHMGLTLNTVDSHIKRTKAKMRMTSTVVQAVHWDRWKREGPK